jgi:hypothetical protein
LAGRGVHAVLAGPVDTDALERQMAALLEVELVKS